MAELCEVKVAVTVIDSTGVALDRTLLPVRFAPSAAGSWLHEELTLAVGDNAITVPSGATALLLELDSSAPALTLKGAAGDTGTTLVPASNPAGVALLLPLGTSPALIIHNGGSGSYKAPATFV